MRANLVIPSLASLAIAMAASPAGAQTVISRTISPQPVETIVTQTPTGTVVTRRPVDAPVMAQPGIVAPAIAQPVLGAPAVAGTDTIDTIDAVTTRAVVRRAEAAPPRRQLIAREVAARPEARTERKAVRTTKTTTPAARAAPRLVLNPRERQIVYQTIVEREVIPRQQVVVVPAALAAPYGPPVAVPARPPVVDAGDVVLQPAPIPVGSVLPESVPLYAIPQNVALGVPATRPYSYAYIGGRAYLVDPVTGTVVADVTED
jgi:uncharacterized protein DUF1236